MAYCKKNTTGEIQDSKSAQRGLDARGPPQWRRSMRCTRDASSAAARRQQSASTGHKSQGRTAGSDALGEGVREWLATDSRATLCSHRRRKLEKARIWSHWHTGASLSGTHRVDEMTSIPTNFYCKGNGITKQTDEKVFYCHPLDMQE